MENKGLNCEIIKEGIIIIIVKNNGDLNQDASYEGSKKQSNFSYAVKEVPTGFPGWLELMWKIIKGIKIDLHLFPKKLEK